MHPAPTVTCPDIRIAVCYDGCWYQNAARYFVRMRGAQLSLPGLHDALRWHAAGVFGCAVQRVTITQAHYVAGRDTDAPSAGWDQMLADHGIIRHDVPVSRGKGEIGADVELALTCYQVAFEGRPDMIVLLAGDGDFAPLAARLVGRGLRVLVPRANFSSLRRLGPRSRSPPRSMLTRRATDAPALIDLVDAAMGPDYPLFLGRPLGQAATSDPESSIEPVTQYHGTVSRWVPGASYGFITGGGLTWYASTRETPSHAALAPGTQVTFTGQASPPPGKLYPPACAIVRRSVGIDAPPEATRSASLDAADSVVGAGKHWLTIVDSTALVRWRQQRGWSRGELARQSGISVTTINRLERADLSCHVRTVSRVAAALGQPASALTRSPATSR